MPASMSSSGSCIAIMGDDAGNIAINDVAGLTDLQLTLVEIALNLEGESQARELVNIYRLINADHINLRRRYGEHHTS